jgi:hypothetical protein
MNSFIVGKVVDLCAVSTRRRKARRTVGTYEVESIIDRRPIPGRADEYEYLTTWKGYDESHHSWEPLANLKNAMEIVTDFEKSIPAPVPVTQPDVEVPLVQDDRVCQTCQRQCLTHTDMIIHAYQEHGSIPPAYDLSSHGWYLQPDLIRELQQRESEFKIIFDSDCGKKDVEVPTRCGWYYTHNFVIADDGLLYCIDLPGRRTRSRVRTHLRLCIPRAMRQSVMSTVHGSKLSGHPGIKRMIDKLIENVWWPSIHSDVVHFISSCRLCQAAKQRRMKIPTQPSNIPSGPWSQIAVDFTGPLPLTSRGNVYILVCVDKFTRYAVAIATIHSQLTYQSSV